MQKEKRQKDLCSQKIQNGKKEFEQKFPYTETNDQLRSIEEMKKRYGKRKANG